MDMKYVRAKIREARDNPEIPIEGGIIPSNYKAILQHLRKYPNDIYIGEWKEDTFGNRIYVRVHPHELGTELKEIQDEKKIKKPTLTTLITVADLEKKIREAA